MNNLNQPNVFASGKSENANSVICELGIKNETIFIKTITYFILQQYFQYTTKIKAICNSFIFLEFFEKTVNKYGSPKVEEYSIKTYSQSLNSNAETISSNSI